MKSVSVSSRKFHAAWAIMAATIVLLAAPAVSLAQGGISLGLRTQDWMFMWRDGRSLAQRPHADATERLRWRVTLATLDRYRQLGAQWNLVVLYEGVDGPDNFSRAKAAVAAYEKRGIQPVFRIIESPAIYSDLSRTESAKYGYSKKYYQWIRSIAETFHNDVRFYLISNEPDSNLMFNIPRRYRHGREVLHVSYSQYSKLLATAYKAIKSVDSNLQVVNGGVSGFALGLAVVDKLIHEGRLVDAAEFWEKFNYHRAAGHITGLIRLLNRPGMSARLDFVRQSFADPGMCDEVQLHYYESWEALPDVMAWINKTMVGGKGRKPIFATEVGYQLPIRDHRPDYAAFSQQNQAIDLVKDFVVLFGNGVRYAEYWPARTTNPRDVIGPLYAATMRADDFRPYRAATAYQVLAHALNGTTLSASQPALGSAVTAYTFGGQQHVTVLWSKGGTTIVSMKPFGAGAHLENIYGESLPGPAGGTIHVGSEPVYVFW